MKFLSSYSLHVLFKQVIITFSVIIAATFFVNAQWSQTNGPVGITINKLYDSENGLYAGSSAKGVFRSTDHGVNWQAANTGIENTEIYSFTEDGDYLYAGSLQGVYRSADNGATWEWVSSGIEDKAIYEMTTGDGYIFAGTIGNGVYRSSDQGMTWEDANGGSLGFSFILAMCYVGNRLIVEGDNYIYYSFDNGDSWNLDQGAQFYPIENFFVTNDTIYASAYGGVFYSYDGGATWSDFISISSIFNHNVLGFAKSNDTLFVGFADGMYYSTDHAQSWTQITQTGLRFGNRFSHTFIKSGSRYLVGMDELGIYSSSDVGATWIHGIKGITPASTIDNCMMAIGDDIWTGTHSNGVFQTDDSGLNWGKVGTTSDQDTLSNAIVFGLFSPAPNIILAGTCSYGLYRSDDNGATWTHIMDGLPFADNGGFECDHNFAKVGDNVLIATTDGLFYSTDLGLTWLPSNLATSGTNIEAIAANGNVACAGVTNPSGIYRSTNFGVTWDLVSQASDVVSMASDGVDHFYAGTLIEDNWRSPDNGLSWDDMSNGIPSGSGGFAIEAIDSNVFVGNSAGIFWSSDYGESFTDAGEGLDPYPNNSVQGLTANSTYLFAGLFRDAVWKRPLSDFGIGDVATGTPTISDKKFFIENSPNPFNAATTITYSIPSSGNVSIEISDVTGKILFERNETSVPAGSHSFNFNGSQLASGIYFATLKADNDVKVQKMILSR